MEAIKLDKSLDNQAKVQTSPARRSYQKPRFHIVSRGTTCSGSPSRRRSALQWQSQRSRRVLGPQTGHAPSAKGGSKLAPAGPVVLFYHSTAAFLKRLQVCLSPREAKTTPSPAPQRACDKTVPASDWPLSRRRMSRPGHQSAEPGRCDKRCFLDGTCAYSCALPRWRRWAG